MGRVGFPSIVLTLLRDPTPMPDPDLSAIDFGEHAAKPSSDRLVELTDLVAEMEIAEVALVEASAILAQRASRLKGIVEHELPELMLELKQPVLHTSDGRRIEIKDVVHGTLPAARRPLGHKWLMDSGNAGLIKRTVEIAFAAVEGEKAKALLETMEAEYAGNARQVMKVESSTLTSFIKKQLVREADPEYKGKRLPLDIFEVREFKHAKISKPK